MIFVVDFWQILGGSPYYPTWIYQFSYFSFKGNAISDAPPPQLLSVVAVRIRVQIWLQLVPLPPGCSSLGWVQESREIHVGKYGVPPKIYQKSTKCSPKSIQNPSQIHPESTQNPSRMMVFLGGSAPQEPPKMGLFGPKTGYIERLK